ncbi:unnamed protein product [Spirodela intermedia]|uniref:Uncharacterized protein n=1 Tax=Spirodela intermedia TaxID=51605 RepID=A0A7I8LLG1_SPIIN|nr:unnamed protein product [Spirodela intermedia]
MAKVRPPTPTYPPEEQPVSEENRATVTKKVPVNLPESNPERRDIPPDLPKVPRLIDSLRWHIARFHNNWSAAAAAAGELPLADSRYRPKEFLHYLNPISVYRLPPPTTFRELPPRCRRREALYSFVFSSNPRSIRRAPLSRESLSQFLYDSLAVAEGERDGATGFLPRVNHSSGGSHPTVAHVFAPPVLDLLEEPFAAHYSPEGHALEVRALLDWDFFCKELPPKAMIVGISTIYWREVWRHGDRAFRYCHLDVGQAIAAVAFAAAALGWGVSLLDGLSRLDLETLMGLRPFRTSGCFRGRERRDNFPSVELQNPVCAVLIFPAAAPKFRIIYRSLSDAISRYFGSVAWAGEPSPLAGGVHIIYHEIYRTSAAIERFWTCNQELLIEPNRLLQSRSFPELLGYENLTVREACRSPRSRLLMDPGHELDPEAFYQFLYHCLPSGHPEASLWQKRWSFPFRVFRWNSRIEVFIAVNRVKKLARGLYCLVRNAENLQSLKRTCSPFFRWEHSREWSRDLPLYRLLLGDLEEKIAEIAFDQPVAMNSCFTMMMVRVCGGVPGSVPSNYPQLFWEAGVLCYLLSLDAYAMGLTASGIGSFFDKQARRLLDPGSGLIQTLCLCAVGKPRTRPE